MKVKLKILNVFYLIFSVIAVGAYFLMRPFLNMTMTYRLSESVIEEAEMSEEPFEQLGITAADLFKDLPENEDTGEQEIVFTAEVKIDFDTLLTAWFGVSNSATSVQNFVSNNVLGPSLEKAFYENDEELIEDNLVTMAESALETMYFNVIEKTLYKMSDINLYSHLEEKGYSKQQVKQSCRYLTVNTFRGSRQSFIVLFDEEIGKYVNALSDNEEDKAYYLTLMERDVTEYLTAFGAIDDYGSMSSVEEVVGNILQRFIDNEDYAEGEVIDDDEESSYLEEDSDFETYTQLFLEVLKRSNFNSNNGMFVGIVLLVRALGVLFVSFVAMWAVKIIQCLVGFFRKKPYIRMNPVGIITGILEVGLAAISVVTVILYRYTNINTMRVNPYIGPYISSLLPVGFSFELLFGALIPGIMVILNFLFSIVYGPVKKKFKTDAKEEMLYSTEQYDYE